MADPRTTETAALDGLLEAARAPSLRAATAVQAAGVDDLARSLGNEVGRAMQRPGGPSRDDSLRIRDSARKLHGRAHGAALKGVACRLLEATKGGATRDGLARALGLHRPAPVAPVPRPRRVVAPARPSGNRMG